LSAEDDDSGGGCDDIEDPVARAECEDQAAAAAERARDEAMARCDADVRQLSVNTGLHLAGAGVFSSIARLSKAGGQLGVGYATTFMVGAAGEPFAWASWFDDSGSQNPFTNSFLGVSYEMGKAAPGFSLLIDAYESATSCTAALFGG
jgi:hypothetical protein